MGVGQALHELELDGKALVVADSRLRRTGRRHALGFKEPWTKHGSIGFDWMEKGILHVQESSADERY